MHIITNTVVLIRLHKKVDLLETKLILQKVERFMWMKISFDLGKMDTIDLVIQTVG